MADRDAVDGKDPTVQPAPLATTTHRLVRNVVGRIAAPLVLAGYFLGLTDEF